jgi:hypothetical protein
MISLYSFDLNKYKLLKLANTIIFFFLKKKNEEEYNKSYINALNILKKSNKLILNIIEDKKYYCINNIINGNDKKLTNTNLFIIIADIITGLISKIKKVDIFEMDDKLEVFDIIYNYYINEMNINYENEKDLDHICILLVELSDNLNLQTNLYKKTLNLFLDKNKKSNYLIKEFFEMSNDINLKKNIIKDMILNIEKNEDSKNILIELLSLEKNNDTKKELLLDINDDLQKILISHITDLNYNTFFDNIIEFVDNIYIMHIIIYYKIFK